MSDRPPPPPSWSSLPPDPPKGRFGGFFGVTGMIVLVLTAIVGVPVLIFAGCVSSFSGHDFFSQVFGLVFAFIVLGVFLLWLGRQRPTR